MFIQKLSSTIASSVAKIKLTKPLTVVHDTVVLAQNDFTPLEKKLMEEVRLYSQKHNVETARVISMRGDLLDLDVTLESYNHTSVASKVGMKLFGKDLGILGKKLKLKKDLKNSIYIHSHTIDTPLSAQDIMYLLSSKIRKITATTPNGHFSSLEIPKNLFYNKKKAITESIKMQYMRELRNLNLGLLDFGIDSKTIYHFSDADFGKMKEYHDFSIKQLEDFADKFGFKFKHNFT